METVQEKPKGVGGEGAGPPGDTENPRSARPYERTCVRVPTSPKARVGRWATRPDAEGPGRSAQGPGHRAREVAGLPRAFPPPTAGAPRGLRLQRRRGHWEAGKGGGVPQAQPQPPPPPVGAGPRLQTGAAPPAPRPPRARLPPRLRPGARRPRCPGSGRRRGPSCGAPEPPPPPLRGRSGRTMRELAIEIGVRALLFGVFV